MSAPLAVNGRFLRATPTGLHRVARPLLHAAIEAGLDAEVLAPPGVADPLADRTLSWPLGGRGGDQAWEQLRLPSGAERRPLLSLTNTAPLAARRGVVMVHDLAPLVGPQWFVPSMRAYGRLVLTAARRAELVLTVSQQVADELAGRGVRAPISVVRQAVGDIAAASEDAVAETRQRHGLSSPYVLMLGWADPRKDAVTAVAAHSRALRTAAHELVLVGLPHPVFAPVSLPDLPSVRRLSYVSDTERDALLTGAAAVLSPSRYEGFGRPALEAWQCGTPALVSDLPSVREATRGRATYLPVGDVDAWAEAIVAAVDGSVPAPAPDPWTWTDAAGELLTALAAVAPAAVPPPAR